MKILLPVVAAGLAALGWPTDDPPSASERYEALITSVANAAALEYSFEGEMTFRVDAAPIDLPTDGGRAEIFGEVRMAWPNAGRAVLSFRPLLDGEEHADGHEHGEGEHGGHDADAHEHGHDEEEEHGEGSEADVVHNEFIGTGEQVYYLDPASRTANPMGGEWSFLQPETPLITAYLLREQESYESVREVAEDGRPGQQGLHATYADGRSETIWMGEDGKVIEIDHAMEDGGVRIEIRVAVSGWKVLAEADKASYAVELPEGYEIAEFEESGGAPDYEAALLALGEQAPDVTLMGMDDAEFQLSSLKGKTVLLNFWFYH